MVHPVSVDSAEFRRRAPRVQLSDDPDTATAQTVAEMARQIHGSAQDPVVRRLSFNAVRTIRGGPLWVGSGIQPFENPRVMAESCWWWCKHYLRFKHHGDMFEVWSAELGDPSTKLQLLISPDVLVQMARLEGDCAIYTMMVCAMLEALGLRWEICTGAVDASQPEIFSHVWPRLVLPDGGREPLDASHGKYPGWQVPAYDIHRLRVWDESGRLVSDRGPQFGGLHAYRSRGFGRRGLGDDASDTFVPVDTLPSINPNVLDSTGSSGGYYNPTQVFGPNLYTDWSSVSAAPSNAGFVVPSQSSAQWAGFASQLLKSGMTLAEINSIQPGTVVSANGAILRQATGLPVPVPGSSITTALGSSSLLMYGGLAVAALLLASMARK